MSQFRTPSSSSSNPLTNFFENLSLPHRKILILGAVCLSGIGITLAYKVANDKKLLAEQTGVSALSGTSAADTLADSRVIQALQDARLAALGALATSSNPFLPTPRDNVSDRFTKDLFTAYVTAEENGTDLPDSEDFINNLDYISTANLEKDKYSLAFLSIFTPVNKDQIKAYGNIFATTYLEAVRPVSENQAAYQTDLSLMIPVYRKLGEALIKVKVPEAVASAHLQLANDYLKQADAFVLINKETSDPVQALLGLKVVREGMERQVEMFGKITEYFNNNGIIFGETEPGNFWNVGTSTYALE